MRYFFFFAISLLSTCVFSQSLDDEIGFLYTKAKYLISTDRGEDAIKVLNKIIAQDKNFEDALLLRAEAKYELGAYAGVRKDLNEYMSKNGISARVARLYGLTDFQGGKEKAALNSLNLAVLEIMDDKLLFETRASLLEKEGQLLQACKDYRSAAKLGSSKAKRRANRLCGKEIKEVPSHREEDKADKTSKPASDEVLRSNTSNTSKSKSDEVVKENGRDNIRSTPDTQIESDLEEDIEVMDDTVTKKDEDAEDTSINELKIDDDLTLLISGEGLGSREIMNKPNILIISDQSGSVTVDICVSRGGRVTSATFDNINSTIKKQSLVSLAVRKAKEFWFDAGIGSDKCGKIVFQISTGS